MFAASQAISLLKRLRRLSPQELGLLLQAWPVLAGVRVVMKTLPGPALTRMAQPLTKGRGETHPDLKRLAWAIKTAGRFLPGGKHCLSQAVALKALAATRGQDLQIELGVLKRDGEVLAHAWIECGGSVLLGNRADLDQFERITPPMFRSSGTRVE